MGELALAPEQYAALDSVGRTLGATAMRTQQAPPFPGGPASASVKLAWESPSRHGRLVAAVNELEGSSTQSTWISIEDTRLHTSAWLRASTRALEADCLGAHVPHRRSAIGDAALDEALVLGMPPTSEELSALYGPGSYDTDSAVRASDSLLERCRPMLVNILASLRELGDFIVEVQDGTLSVRFPHLLPSADAYSAAIDAASTLLDRAVAQESPA